MPASALAPSALSPLDYARALAARDPRFDGLFFVGITTTRIYCRPVCPARVTHHDRRRFFDTAAAAEHAGFRPCMRCRPELAPGRSSVDAVSRLAGAAAELIADGALNGSSVGMLARRLGVSERHLRRALEREIGVSPLALAQTHRLLLAKRLLADTSLPVSRIAYASGFQSLRRFNATFRERYRLAPSAIRHMRSMSPPRAAATDPLVPGDSVKLTLAYRAPLAWRALLEFLSDDALPGVELVDGDRYARAVSLGGHAGLTVVSHSDAVPARSKSVSHHLDVRLSAALIPAVMPLLARVRRLFDLDAEPALIDAHLVQGGLRQMVKTRPGLRLPGSLGGFEAAFRALLRNDRGRAGFPGYVSDVIAALGTPVLTGDPRIGRCVPTAKRVAAAGAARLMELGVPAARAHALAAVARAVTNGTLRLDRGSDPERTRHALLAIDGVDDATAAKIVMRALNWPDAFSATDRTLQSAAGAANSDQLRTRAEDWRPWRSYAAMHLWMRRARN